MTDTGIKSRFYILHLEVSHGADRYDIHLHLPRPPLVRDVMQEIEKKSRVTLMNQQLLFRGQRLHQTPDKSLESFGIFNGNRLVLVGEKLTGLEDEHFRRLLDIGKDVKLIDDVLELVCRDFETLKETQQPRERCENFLQDLQARSERCHSDLKTFQTITNNINVHSSEVDAYRKKNEINTMIRDRIDISLNITAAISAYQGGNN